MLQEIGVLRQQILVCEGELRTVSSPAYTAKDRDKALAEQSVSVRPTFGIIFCLFVCPLSHFIPFHIYVSCCLLSLSNIFLVSALYFCSDETRVASVLISRQVSNLLLS